MKRCFILLLFIGLVAGAVSCKSKGSGEDDKAKGENADSTETGAVPVTVEQPTTGSIGDSIELNAISSFLVKTFVKSSATGYLQLVNATLGHYISRGQDMFIVKTKEAQSLGSTITSLDTSFHFNGVIHIKAPTTGFVSQLSYRSGDYVQDGEQLAAITDTKSLVFVLSLPYELKPYLASNRQLPLRLPDGTIVNGVISQAMPTVDSVSQTQNFLIRVNSSLPIPENLVAKVHLIKQFKPDAVSLPKSAILSDETQSQFWIMKMIDSVTAVKVVIRKGIEAGNRVEVVSPRLLSTDLIVTSGNYGLADTARVSISK